MKELQVELKAPEKLYKEQVKLEMGMQERGKQKYLYKCNYLQERERENETSYGSYIIDNQLHTMTQAITDKIAYYKKLSNAGRGVMALPVSK